MRSAAPSARRLHYSRNVGAPRVALNREIKKMHVRCNYCRHSFNLSRDYMVQAIKEAREKRQKYAAVECLNCRKLIKVPIAQMQRYVPEDELTESSAD
jgi:DNA-directed RNA polymerase subunit RPC12/RpoP